MRVVGGSGFARLWGATAVSNVGDGVYATALPLLAASLTRDPLLVSLGVGGLAVAVLLDQAGIALLAVVGFVLGTGQTLVDTGPPSRSCPRSSPARRTSWSGANGRLVGTQVVA